MRRRLFTAASRMSGAVCVGVVLAWLCSLLAFAPFGQSWTTSWAGNGEGRVSHGWFAAGGAVYLLVDERTMSPPPTVKPDDYRRTGIEPFAGVAPPRTTFGFLASRSLATWPEPGRKKDRKPIPSVPGVLARETACWIERELCVFLNIQDTEGTEKSREEKGFSAKCSGIRARRLRRSQVENELGFSVFSVFSVSPW
jgi:hypothetical protein